MRILPPHLFYASLALTGASLLLQTGRGTIPQPYGIGLAMQKQGKTDQAFESFVAAKSADGGKTEISPKSQFMIGEMHFQRREFDDALAAFKRVCQCHANAEWSSRALYEAAKAQKELKRWKEAAETYEHLIREFPRTPQSREAKEDLKKILEKAKAP